MPPARPAAVYAGYRRGVYRFLLRPRWLALTLAVVLVAVACVQLGRWQLHRLEERRARNVAVAAAANAAPAPVADLLRVGGSVSAEQEWRRVEARGHYDADHEMIVRLRPEDGRSGVHALTPLVTEEGPALLVDRGFVAASGSGESAQLPPPPSGSVGVVARVRASEEGQGSGGDPAAGAIRFVDVDEIAATLPYPVYGGWAELVAHTPAAADAGRDTAPEMAAPQPIDLPAGGDGPHLAYALQWFLFAALALVGWVLLARAEARERRRRSAAVAAAAPTTSPGTPANSRGLPASPAR